ncbi:MAG: cupin domain-containing protein [Betaproteobacteria bacterium]|nr:cupin domain-containing protein [Betaproteobacteria bacterium]
MASKFAVNHRQSSQFKRRGLRAYFEYRDLGIDKASGGKVVAHVIRARPGKAPHGQWHRHDCELQFVYVLKGTAVFEYEGIGKVRMKPGSCFFQPPGIRHREISHSKDLELLEIVAPANFKTVSEKQTPAASVLEKPAARKSRARRSPG